MTDVYRVSAERRHADAGGRRPLRHRVLRRAGAGRRRGRDHRARVRGFAVVAQRPQSSRRERDLARSRLTRTSRSPGGAKDAWPMWVADAKTLYFMSDRSGAQKSGRRQHAPIKAPARAARSRSSSDGRVLWPSITRDGNTIAFERDFGIWTVDTATGQAREVPITLRGAPAGAAVEHRTFTDQIQELALSPDGKKVAFTVHGEMFSASAKDGGDAMRVTNTAGDEVGSHLGARQPAARLRVRSRRHRPSVSSTTSAAARRRSSPPGPRRRPCAAVLARRQVDRVRARYARAARRRSRVTKQERALATGVFDVAAARPIRATSPGRRTRSGRVPHRPARRAFTNVNVVPADGGEATQPVSFLANTNGGSLVLEPRRHVPDVRHLASAPSRARSSAIDLLPRTPKFREDQFRDLFKDEHAEDAAAAHEPPAGADVPSRSRRPTAGDAEPLAAPVEDRVRRHPPPRERCCRSASTSAARTISPDGKWLLLTATRRRPAESLRLLARRAVEASRRSRGSSRRRRARSAARSSRPTARRSTTSIAAASSTSRSRSASRSDRRHGGARRRFRPREVEVFQQAGPTCAIILRREDERRRLERGARRRTRRASPARARPTRCGASSR